METKTKVWLATGALGTAATMALIAIKRYGHKRYMTGRNDEADDILRVQENRWK